MANGCECVCDRPDEVCDFIAMTHPRARVPHTCCECGHTIRPGEVYRREFTKYDGMTELYVTCKSCARVRDDMCKCGWIFGELWERIHDAICDDEFCVCPTRESEAADADD